MVSILYTFIIFEFKIIIRPIAFFLTIFNYSHSYRNTGCGAKACILIRDDQANQGNVNDPDVNDWLLINGAYKNPILVNNNIPSNKYVLGSYFCGSGIGRDDRAQGQKYSLH